MNAKHTPGPWVANARHEGRTNGADIVVECAGGSSPIAVCNAINTMSPGGDQREANARLIASAPAMLEALRDLVSNGRVHEVDGMVVFSGNWAGWQAAWNKAVALAGGR